jgi:hypothetical protein
MARVEPAVSWPPPRAWEATLAAVMAALGTFGERSFLGFFLLLIT